MGLFLDAIYARRQTKAQPRSQGPFSTFSK